QESLFWSPPRRLRLRRLRRLRIELPVESSLGRDGVALVVDLIWRWRQVANALEVRAEFFVGSRHAARHDGVEALADLLAGHRRTPAGRPTAYRRIAALVALTVGRASDEERP